MITRKESFFGIPVSIFTLSELRGFILLSIEESSGNILYGFSLHSIYNISRIPEIVKLGKDADLIVSDGRPFFWLLKLFKIPVKCNMSIPESVMLTLKIANEKKSSLLLFGSEKLLNEKACSNIKEIYPDIKVLEGIPGYFNFDTDFEKILNKIYSLNPDILLIGISSPLKESLAFNYKSRLNARLIIPCGGMIDILAGKTKLTPPFIKSLGLASLYRIIQEPRRLLSDRLRFYSFIFFDFLPVLFWNSIFRRGKDFSIIDHYLKS
jgi:N-acetylglucosaminyldiphosphoundecaprenol N-acetyl-beta-D-mannosaminyltransferase